MKSLIQNPKKVEVYYGLQENTLKCLQAILIFDEKEIIQINWNSDNDDMCPRQCMEELLKLNVKNFPKPEIKEEIIFTEFL